MVPRAQFSIATGAKRVKQWQKLSILEKSGRRCRRAAASEVGIASRVVGKLRPLAVTTSTRLEVLRDIPTVGDYLPGFEVSGWLGIGAPKLTPAETIEKLNKEINAGLSDPKIKARFAELGGMALTGSPTDFGKHIADETEKWGKVIRAANIKAE